MTQFREGLKAHVLSTIASDITARRQFEAAVKAQKEICEQYAAELQAFEAAGMVKCREADQVREQAFKVSSRAKKFRAAALDNLEYDLRTHKG